jgi:glycosyltransferase involved in cell wall biosynthesis
LNGAAQGRARANPSQAAACERLSAARRFDARRSAPIILHVPFGYFPDPCGGTEVYVRGLARRLNALGHPSAIAAPGAAAAEYEDADLEVFRFASDPSGRIEFAYGAPDDVAAQGFARIVERVRPKIVHLHARTAAVSERLMDVAHAAGAAVVFTYHTPTASCVRGTMLLFGETPCDGRVGVRRCTACALAGLGAPRAAAWAAASLPEPVKRLAAPPAATGAAARLAVPQLMADAEARILAFLAKADHVVAVADWVRDILRRNGVDERKLSLSRQGVDLARDPAPRTARSSGPLRIAYFGRIDRTKGPDLLAEALALAPAADVCIDVYGIDQSGAAGPVHERLRRQAAADPRLQLRPPLAQAHVPAAMAGYDLVAVPSRWLETGPLVVLEAFAAGVPVLGAMLGGIAELVADGVDGVLVAPGDPAAWAEAMVRLAADRPRVEALQAGVRPPRTMDAAAADMAALYDRLLAPAAA